MTRIRNTFSKDPMCCCLTFQESMHPIFAERKRSNASFSGWGGKNNFVLAHIALSKRTTCVKYVLVSFTLTYPRACNTSQNC